jgi:hypothetical protein
MFSLKLVGARHTPMMETGRSDSSDASSFPVIRGLRVSLAGVTAHVTVEGISNYSRRQR